MGGVRPPDDFPDTSQVSLAVLLFSEKPCWVPNEIRQRLPSDEARVPTCSRQRPTGRRRAGRACWGGCTASDFSWTSLPCSLESRVVAAYAAARHERRFV